MKNMNRLSQEVRTELERNILPFWTQHMKDPEGGFFGRMDGLGKIHPEAPRGAILGARILWTFASAYRMLGDLTWKAVADHAYGQIRDRFVDPEYGGIYWSLDAQGQPLDTKKQFYAIAFAIYGLAEYFRATGHEEALALAIRLFLDIESHSLDPDKGGYLEAATRDWSPIADMRLSEKDRNDAKTMNTHLHILEGYTALYRVWKDETLRHSLTALVEIFLDRIIRPDGHLGLFFNEDWREQSEAVSYGHDIECSWLLYETAEVLGDARLMERVRACSIRMADAAIEGLRTDGGMIYESDPATGAVDGDRHWWVQAETVVGCLNQYQLRGDKAWLDRSLTCWDFIKRHLLCPDGEWYWSLRADGTPNTDDDRAGFWKCPYHNGRMCMEIIQRSSARPSGSDGSGQRQ